jgi:hypothetical protein
MSMNTRIAMTLLVMVVFPCSRAASTQSSLSPVLAAARSVKCVFPLYTVGTWADGEPKAELKKASLSVAFDEIDIEDGTARAKGPYGDLHITAKLSTWSLHLLEISGEGMLRITTVFDKESRPGKYMAVHTRHEYTEVSLPGFTSRPEQYYGDCEISTK